MLRRSIAVGFPLVGARGHLRVDTGLSHSVVGTGPYRLLECREPGQIKRIVRHDARASSGSL